jgi:hypothetical protein
MEPKLASSDRSALQDALHAWRDLLWARALADRRCEFELWSRILARHLEATR